MLQKISLEATPKYPILTVEVGGLARPLPRILFGILYKLTRFQIYPHFATVEAPTDVNPNMLNLGLLKG